MLPQSVIDLQITGQPVAPLFGALERIRVGAFAAGIRSGSGSGVCVIPRHYR